MQNRPLKFALFTLTVLAVGGVLYLTTAQPGLPGTGDTAEVSRNSAGDSAPASRSPSSDELDEEVSQLDESALAALLEDPRVQGYLAREQDKLALDAYFTADASSLSDSEAWSLIEKIEADGRVMAYEALTLKLAWLEHNSANEAEFQEAAGDLVAEYRERAERSARDYDPYEDVPGFAEYKEAERRILQEVGAMESFPEGMSQQEYLRMRLQQAREDAYGS